MKKELGFGLFILIVVISAVVVLFGGLFSVIDSRPNCEFVNGVCNIEMTLEADREYTEFIPTFDFAGVPDAEFGSSTTVTSLHSASSVDNDVDIQTFYLFKPPTDWTNIYEIEMTSQVSGTYKGDRSGIGIYNFYFDGHDGGAFSYPSNTVDKSSCSRISECSPSTIIQQHESSDSRELNVVKAGQKAEMCLSSSCASQTFNKNMELVSVVPNKVLVGRENSEIGLFVSAEHFAERDTSSSPTASVGQPTLSLAYKQMNYPTNVGYGVNGNFIEVLSGERKETVRVLDIASQINSACNRETDVSTCTFTLSFVSEKGGMVYLDSVEETLRVAEVEVIEEPIPPVEEEPAEVPEEPAEEKTPFLQSLVDFDNYSTTAWAILVVVIFGIAMLILFVPSGGKR